ncbi:hypothetical protein D3C81_2169190 [compost metagenome]
MFGNFKAVDATDQGGLAGAGGAAQHDAFTFAYLQVDVAQHMESAIVLVQALDADQHRAWVVLRGKAGNAQRGGHVVVLPRGVS